MVRTFAVLITVSWVIPERVELAVFSIVFPEINTIVCSTEGERLIKLERTRLLVGVRLGGYFSRNTRFNGRSHSRCFDNSSYLSFGQMLPLTALKNWVIPARITFEFNQILASKQQLKTHIPV